MELGQELKENIKKEKRKKKSCENNKKTKILLLKEKERKKDHKIKDLALVNKILIKLIHFFSQKKYWITKLTK